MQNLYPVNDSVDNKKSIVTILIAIMCIDELGCYIVNEIDVC